MAAGQGLMMVGLPEVTVVLVQAMARKTGQSMPDVISSALHLYLKATLKEPEILALQKELDALVEPQKG